MPEEKKNLTTITAVLLVVLAFSLLSMVIRINARLKKIKRPSASGYIQPLDSQGIPSEAELESYFSKTLITRNPFILGGTTKDTGATGTEKGGFLLTAIIWDEFRPMAIVNNKVVGINSEINGAKIISIEKNKVKIDSGDKIIELELYLKGGKKYEQ